MLIDEKLIRTNFSDGLKMKYGVFEKNDTYLENKFKILSLGGLGYGILQGYKNSLSLAIEGNLLVVKSGAAIDKYGNLIYIPESVSIRDRISVTDFAGDKYTYVYIRYKEEKGGLQPHRDSNFGDIHSELINSYAIDIGNYKHTDSEWIELGRVYIDYKKMSQYNQHTIINPMNPFLPRENEIDSRQIPRIVTNLVHLKEEDRRDVYKILGSFADYLNEIAFRYKLISASTASSFVYLIREDISTNIIDPYSFYHKLKSAVDVVTRIKDENSKIQGSDFWKNITRLMELFSENFGDTYKGEINFYKFNLAEQSYFGNILKHFFRAGQCSRELNLNVREKPKPKPIVKTFVQVGRSDKKEHGNDITFATDKTMSRIHLKVTAYRGGFMIEDMSANGTFVNAERVRKGVKKFVRPSDNIVMGKNGTKLNLNDPKIQNLLNL
jgi:hypothetical protein